LLRGNTRIVETRNRGPGSPYSQAKATLLLPTVLDSKSVRGTRWCPPVNVTGTWSKCCDHSHWDKSPCPLGVLTTSALPVAATVGSVERHISSCHGECRPRPESAFGRRTPDLLLRWSAPRRSANLTRLSIGALACARANSAAFACYEVRIFSFIGGYIFPLGYAGQCINVQIIGE